jgi:hypothetical protein
MTGLPRPGVLERGYGKVVTVTTGTNRLIRALETS